MRFHTIGTDTGHVSRWRLSRGGFPRVGGVRTTGGAPGGARGSRSRLALLLVFTGIVRETDVSSQSTPSTAGSGSTSRRRGRWRRQGSAIRSPSTGSDPTAPLQTAGLPRLRRGAGDAGAHLARRPRHGRRAGQHRAVAAGRRAARGPLRPGPRRRGGRRPQRRRRGIRRRMVRLRREICTSSKGSITVEGVSLTVAATRRRRLRGRADPHTLEVTTLGDSRRRRINLESTCSRNMSSDCSRTMRSDGCRVAASLQRGYHDVRSRSMMRSPISAPAAWSSSSTTRVARTRATSASPRRRSRPRP